MQRAVTTLVTLLPAAIYSLFLRSSLPEVKGQSFRHLLERQRDGRKPLGNIRGRGLGDSLGHYRLYPFVRWGGYPGLAPVGWRYCCKADRTASPWSRRPKGPAGFLLVDEYNHKIGNIDIVDQMRSYHRYFRPTRRGVWQAIAWNFLFELIHVVALEQA
ncbi:hypothetical protein CT0861_04284 [Colletotrichum tofieldiae]|uniref:Uncharacterized protein n=1 Tax=Colletotrichum tofieldiae TaxID=708197 RepID=A0A166UC63_9PEZI|nr:hypothetical protein CT0861_04284 [Colletotrichum tofieldiae]